MCPPATSYVKPSTTLERHSPPGKESASNKWMSFAGCPPSMRKRASEAGDAGAEDRDLHVVVSRLFRTRRA
jgi:hypothetical protein